VQVLSEWGLQFLISVSNLSCASSFGMGSSIPDLCFQSFLCKFFRSVAAGLGSPTWLRGWVGVSAAVSHCSPRSPHFKVGTVHPPSGGQNGGGADSTPPAGSTPAQPRLPASRQGRAVPCVRMRVRAWLCQRRAFVAVLVVRALAQEVSVCALVLRFALLFSFWFASSPLFPLALRVFLKHLALVWFG